MYHSSKEAEIHGFYFDTCDEKISPFLFLQSALAQIWSVSLKCVKTLVYGPYPQRTTSEITNKACS